MPLIVSDSIEPHVIRLRGPWEYEPLYRLVTLDDGSLRETTDPLPPPGRLQMPGDWSGVLGSDFRGRVRFRRRFGRPTGLTASHLILLVIEQVNEIGHVALNGQMLGTIQFGQLPARYDVTHLIETRNELTIEVESRGVFRSGAIGEVRVEIYDHES